MSGGVDIVRALLSADSAVLALVPVGRIGAGVLPGSTQLPAIGLAQISGVDRNIASQGAKVNVTQRIQVTVMAADYVRQEQVIKAVRKACRDQAGTLGGYTNVSVLTDGTGADFQFGSGAGIYMKTQDFKVNFSETP